MISSQREQTLARARQIRSDLAGHIEQWQVVHSQFLVITSQLPGGAVVGYEFNRRRLQARLQQYGEWQDFLTNPRRKRERLQVDSQMLGKAGFAKYLLAEGSEGDTLQRNVDELAAAVQLLTKRLQGLRKAINYLQQARERVLSYFAGAKTLLETSSQLGLAGSNDPTTKQLVLICDLVIQDGIQDTWKDVSEALSLSAQQGRLPVPQILLQFEQLVRLHLKNIKSDQAGIVCSRIQELLEAAARQRAALLHATPRKSLQNRPSRLAQAILGLQFAFACKQNRDCGKLPAWQRQEFEDSISHSSASELKLAVAELLSKEILSPDDFEFFRYVEPVRIAFLSVTNDPPTKQATSPPASLPAAPPRES